MGTITTTQAGKTYKLVQSNKGLRVEFEGREIFRHWPEATTPPETPVEPPVDPEPPTPTPKPEPPTEPQPVAVPPVVTLPARLPNHVAFDQIQRIWAATNHIPTADLVEGYADHEVAWWYRMASNTLDDSHRTGSASPQPNQPPQGRDITARFDL